MFHLVLEPLRRVHLPPLVLHLRRHLRHLDVPQVAVVEEEVVVVVPDLLSLHPNLHRHHRLEDPLLHHREYLLSTEAQVVPLVNLRKPIQQHLLEEALSLRETEVRPLVGQLLFNSLKVRLVGVMFLSPLHQLSRQVRPAIPALFNRQFHQQGPPWAQANWLLLIQNHLHPLLPLLSVEEGQAEQAQASHLHFKLHKVVVQHLCSQLQRLNQYRVKREALQSVEDLHLRSRS